MSKIFLISLVLCTSAVSMGTGFIIAKEKYERKIVSMPLESFKDPSIASHACSYAVEKEYTSISGDVERDLHILKNDSSTISDRLMICEYAMRMPLDEDAIDSHEYNLVAGNLLVALADNQVYSQPITTKELMVIVKQKAVQLAASNKGLPDHVKITR